MTPLAAHQRQASLGFTLNDVGGAQRAEIKFSCIEIEVGFKRLGGMSQNDSIQAISSNPHYHNDWTIHGGPPKSGDDGVVSRQRHECNPLSRNGHANEVAARGGPGRLGG